MSNNKSRIAARRAGGWKGHGWGAWGNDDGFGPRVSNPPAEKPNNEEPDLTPIFGLMDSALTALKEFQNGLNI